MKTPHRKYSEILQDPSLFWISWGPRGAQSKEQRFSSLNFHSITLLWVVNQVPEKSQQGQARWEMDISSLNVSQCIFVTPVSSYQLSRLRLCPLWDFLISCWASNRHVNSECNCEVTKGEARVTKGKRRTEGKESIHKICICSVTRSRSLQGHTAEHHLWQADVSVELHAGPCISMITGKCWQASRSGCHVDSRKIGATQRGFWTSSLYAL